MLNPRVRPTPGTGQARILRRVTRWYKDGRPKAARDYDRLIYMEAVTAIKSHSCTRSPHCRVLLAGVIERGENYLQVVYTGDQSFWLRLPNTEVPKPKKFHKECVPESAKPLLRLMRMT